MNLLCVLISFALVKAFVAVLDIRDKQVIITNRHIELAIDFMPKIIKRIVLGPSSMKEMAFMLAVPEYTDDDNKSRMVLYQIQMQTEIMMSTNIHIQIPEIIQDNFDGNIDLSVYGNKRRIITREATKTLIRGATRDNDRDFEDFFAMCRLIGLFRSIKYPELYMIKAETDKTETCILTDRNGKIIRYRSCTDDRIWELKPNDDLIQPLSDQL
ncbi:uncharacterized protein LOC126835929 [Adelges cooleyi]|uniref:uncharacterized protein LOC126835929 n=1 Tax=Adelges cooleyi TaxID=133065 RepID=UPI00218013F8|nr:uncharacterized protein LOC126835929 [Adelges cooleyi]XP_050424776.1 uncharacterized protein LOC126835929 [Adelges cooleyi]